MSNEKYDTAVVGLALAALDGAQMMIESLRKDRECVTAELAAARLEIESLQAQAQQCGAGAGCCAQAARIDELQAQLEAVGTMPDGMTHREFGQFLSDVLTAAGLVSHGGQSKGLGQRLADAVMRLRAAPQPPAQAQDARKPLTDAQFGDVVSDAHVAFCLYKFATFERALVHFTELAHGIAAQKGDAA